MRSDGFIYVCIAFVVFRHFVLSKRFVILRLSFSSIPTSLLISLHFLLKDLPFFISSADGTATITATAPDTITQWITSAFAVNPVSGLGVASETAKVIYSIFR